MMGNKKLLTIREELRAALSKTAEDPIAWLEQRIATAKRRGTGTTKVLESLKPRSGSRWECKRNPCKRAAGPKKTAH